MHRIEKKDSQMIDIVFVKNRYRDLEEYRRIFTDLIKIDEKSSKEISESKTCKVTFSEVIEISVILYKFNLI